MGRITETHIAVVNMAMVNVGAETNIPVTLMHGHSKAQLI